MIEWVTNNFWLLLFIGWGLPLGHFRSKFRKIVYQTDDWIINIKPLFWKELKGLFQNIYPDDPLYLKTRNWYRLYLTVYSLLFAAYKFLSN